MYGFFPRPTVQRPTPVGTAFDTSFPATENPISQGGIWVNGGADGVAWQDMQTASAHALASNFFSPSTIFNDDIAHLKTSFRTFNADQWCEGTYFKQAGYAPTGSHEMELHLRFQTTANNARGYEILHSAQGNIAVVLWNGAFGDFQALSDPGDGTFANPVDGDVLYAQIVGNVITVKKNGATVATVNITANDTGGNTPHNVWASGQPGMGSWPQSGSDVVIANLGWKRWRADNI